MRVIKISTYRKDSIQKLDPLSFTRLRPDTYCGSTEDSTQLVSEIVSNSVDEHLAGNCDKLSVAIDKKTNIVTVEDWGQGILPNNKQNGKTTLEMVYGDINSSGKYDKSDSAVYKVSTGAFGIGSALTCFLSHFLVATTKRDGEYETVYFVEGKFDHRESGKCKKSEHGVKVVFQPSEEFFDNPAPNEKVILDNANKITCVCPNLTYIFNGEKICHRNGLNDYISMKINNSEELIKERFILDESSSYRRLNLGLSITEKNGNIDAFCNYSPIEAGTPITTVKSCITRTLNKWGQEHNILKQKETLSGEAIQEGMIVVFNLVSKDIRYDSQTKVRVTSTTDNPFINEVLSKQLEIWLDNNPDDGRIILEKALLARRAAEAAKKAREAVRSKTAKKEKVFKLPTTLVDAWTKDRSKAELLVCEGKSAMSGLVAARDSETQAIYGVRGMMISARKSTSEKLLQNQEVNNLILALGLDIDTGTNKLIYDVNKLRYDKIIACADADPAGSAIENLLFNILWYLCPELIKNGHVYSAIPPLFRVITKNNEYIYLKDGDALKSYQEKNKDKVKSISREKGLGEMDSEELSDTLLSPDTRNIVQLTVQDVEQTENIFEMLYGKNVQPRVEYILQHAEEVDVDYE